ncbi:MAG: NADH-quinone oxidoreductase subunit K [Anaerolineaceae bacterium]
MTLTITNIALVGALGLLGIALYGLLASRNLIKVIVALQIVVKGAMLVLIAAGRLQGQMATAQSLALTVIVADTIVAVLGLALAVQVRRHVGTLDVQALSRLRR